MPDKNVPQVKLRKLRGKKTAKKETVVTAAPRAYYVISDSSSDEGNLADGGASEVDHGQNVRAYLRPFLFI